MSDEIPLGLLKRFGPAPENGVGCIVGHPAGAEKKMDHIYIAKEGREQAVRQNLDEYKDKIPIYSIYQDIKNYQYVILS